MRLPAPSPAQRQTLRGLSRFAGEARGAEHARSFPKSLGALADNIQGCWSLVRRARRAPPRGRGQQERRRAAARQIASRRCFASLSMAAKEKRIINSRQRASMTGASDPPEALMRRPQPAPALRAIRVSGRRSANAASTAAATSPTVIDLMHCLLNLSQVSSRHP